MRSTTLFAALTVIGCSSTHKGHPADPPPDEDAAVSPPGTGGRTGGTGGQTGGSPGNDVAAPARDPREVDAAAPRPSVDGPSARDGSASMPVPDAASAAGCGGKYPVCIDFETGALDAKWRASSGTNMKVETSKAAHGQYAEHYSAIVPNYKRTISTSQLGTITNVIWGRFYLYMTSGAPSGHGALIVAADEAGQTYEMGFESSNYFADWHVPAGVPEKYLRSKLQIPRDKWACVEFLFDGGAAALPRVWGDGVEVTWTTIAKTPNVVAAKQFKRLDVGPQLYHGTSLSVYDGTTPPVLTDVWIDDVVVDTKRIGCIQ